MTDEVSPQLADVGGRIRKVREAGGLKLNELALLSGLSAPALSRIETGQRDLRLSSLFRIAAALRVPLADLIEEPSSPIASSPEGEGYNLEDYA
jgi:transcriptional regulator with XRE-family HTH domain